MITTGPFLFCSSPRPADTVVFLHWALRSLYTVYVVTFLSQIPACPSHPFFMLSRGPHHNITNNTFSNMWIFRKHQRRVVSMNFLEQDILFAVLARCHQVCVLASGLIIYTRSCLAHDGAGNSRVQHLAGCAMP
jgi:hypothetical protein